MLRTTALLPALKEQRPGAHVTWVAREDALPLFAGIADGIADGVAGVDRLLPFAWDTLVTLRRETFDEVWSLDFDPAVAAWVPEIPARGRRGFVYLNGVLAALTPESRGWVEMSLNDALKRRNARSYQDWLFETCGLAWDRRYEPRWTVSDAEKRWAQDQKRRWRIPSRKTVLGLNTGAGGRWEQKRWTDDGLRALLKLLKKEKDAAVLLLGGPGERDRNRALKRSFPWTVDTGGDNPLRAFGAIVDLCDLLITGDTMAMHIAVALKKQTVVFFGATAAAEIELYDRGEKVHKDWACLPCYLPRCVRSPNCMEALTAGEVLAAVKRRLALRPRPA